MNKPYTKPALYGFLFGTIGLMFIFGFALASPFTAPLQWLYNIPAIILASVGLLDGGIMESTQSKVIFFGFSGLFYALLFVAIKAGYHYYKGHKPHSPKL